MPIDFAFTLFIIPALLGVAVTTILAIGKPADVAQRVCVAGLTTVRLARGYLGALLATAGCSLVEAIDLGSHKVSLGQISDAELPALLPLYVLYVFVLFTPLVLAVLTLLGLLALSMLRRRNRLTILGIIGVALAFSMALTAWVMAQPSNAWCSAHLAQCGAKQLGAVAMLAVPIALGFALGAGIPLKAPRRADQA